MLDIVNVAEEEQNWLIRETLVNIVKFESCHWTSKMKIDIFMYPRDRIGRKVPRNTLNSNYHLSAAKWDMTYFGVTWSDTLKKLVGNFSSNEIIKFSHLIGNCRGNFKLVQYFIGVAHYYSMMIVIFPVETKKNMNLTWPPLYQNPGSAPGWLIKFSPYMNHKNTYAGGTLVYLRSLDMLMLLATPFLVWDGCNSELCAGFETSRRDSSIVKSKCNHLV